MDVGYCNVFNKRLHIVCKNLWYLRLLECFTHCFYLLFTVETNTKYKVVHTADGVELALIVGAALWMLWLHTSVHFGLIPQWGFSPVIGYPWNSCWGKVVPLLWEPSHSPTLLLDLFNGSQEPLSPPNCRNQNYIGAWINIQYWLALLVITLLSIVEQPWYQMPSFPRMSIQQ
jgi:hypothetical protein